MEWWRKPGSINFPKKKKKPMTKKSWSSIRHHLGSIQDWWCLSGSEDCGMNSDTQPPSFHLLTRHPGPMITPNPPRSKIVTH